MAQTGFWAAIGREARATLMARGRRVVYRDREMIVEQDQPGDTMLIIETGRVEVFLLTPSGAHLVLRNLGPGQILGEIALLDRGPRSASARAAGPVTGVLLHFDDVHGYLMANPEVMFAVIADLTAKLREANSVSEARTSENASVRLARCLGRLARNWGRTDDSRAVQITQAFSQRQLGDLAGLTRETVNRRLKTWESNGWLVRDGAMLTLLDPVALERIASGDDAAPPSELISARAS